MTRTCDGLLIDVGGVLTTDLFAAFDAYFARAGLEGISFRRLYYEMPEAQETIERLERGELGEAAGQRRMAELIGLDEARSATFFRDLYAGVELVAEMTAAVEALHAAGIRTGVLSNSWWLPVYDDPFYERAFDVMVVSGRVGLRKPEPAMFEHAVARLGLPARRIAFVDDFAENLPPARALGLHTIHHDPADPGATIARLSELFAVDLPRSADPAGRGLG